MSLKCGIVGLPNVGKSTLFNCISSGKAQAANFPFCTIEPNIGSTTVPDDRLNVLEKLVNPKRVVPATVEIVDIAGLVKGASKGEGLGNQFLANIRETDAILHILRCFDDSNVVHVDGSVDPIRDKEIIDMELQFKDLETIENRLQKLSKQAKSGGDKVAQRSCDILNRFKEALMAGKSARSVMFDNAEDEKIAREFCLLTYKPVMYVCNVDEGSAATGNQYVERVREAVKDENAEILVIAAKIESEIAELETFEERQMFLEEIGLEKSGVERLIQSAYDLLNLRTYFTAGVQEVRAWTINKGDKAPRAAGVIHTDFEKGFIRAEVIHYEDYVQHGSEAACRAAGKLSIEGKDYTVQDGDVMHFLFNV
ncbi:MAG: redox-regulated ATPase YchF [Bacteroidales bacterium]|nr:redox-regulated ATPase YchF [Bacteroidales bacterium]